MTEPDQNTEPVFDPTTDTDAEPAEGSVEPAPVEVSPEVPDHSVESNVDQTNEQSATSVDTTQEKLGVPDDVAPAGEVAVSERPEFQDPEVLKADPQ